MERAAEAAAKRQFEGFAAEASDTLLRTGYLMTGDAKDAEDLVQETFLRVARRWNRVRSMDYPTAYARRILINLVLQDAERRSRQRAELAWQHAGTDATDQSAARALRHVDDLAEFRWALAQLTARNPCHPFSGGQGQLLNVVPPLRPGHLQENSVITVIRPSALPSGAGLQFIATMNEGDLHRAPGRSALGVWLVQASPQCTGS
ncbi:MAG: RNA polymerase sigma factor [Streptosporangiaceae bacterium]